MTLVIAGFDKDKIFFIADSGIQHSTKHIHSFKKVYELPIMVYQPYFVCTFRGYHLFRECCDNLVFAIAGSTLVAQDIMNVIINHLRYTRVDYTDNTYKSYYLTTHCNPELNCNKSYYGKDFEYIPEIDIMKVVNRNNLKKIIEMSVEHAIDSLRDCSEDDFLNNNEYLFALYCNETKRNYLYKIKINVKKYFDNDNNMIKEKEISIDEINKDELAIIGITRYNSELQQFYSERLINNNQNSFEQLLRKFHEIVKNHPEIVLEDAENNNTNARVYEILHPIVYKKFDRGQIVEKIVVCKDGERKNTMTNSVLKYYIR